VHPLLAPDDLAALAARGQERTAPAGQVLIREGASPGSLFVLRSGRVAITRGGKRLAELGPGDVLGEMAMMEDSARTASAVVLDEAVLLAVPASALRALLAERPALARALAQTAADRARLP
jgi:CRP/FNR family transcriptional regulator, cyclic AMP receptor protein